MNIFLKTIIFLATLISFSSCGYVKRASVYFYEWDHELKLLSKATFNENLSYDLQNTKIDITSPHDMEIIGSLTISSEDKLRLKLNLSKIFSLNESENDNLPNQTKIPYSGIINENTKLFTIENSNHPLKIYVLFNCKQAFIGIAIPIKSITPLYPNISPFNQFLSFDTTGINGTNGYAGMFFGHHENESGIAIFFNITNELKSFMSKTNHADIELNPEIIELIENLR